MLLDALKYFAQTVIEFLLLSAEYTKNDIFWHVNNHNVFFTIIFPERELQSLLIIVFSEITQKYLSVAVYYLAKTVATFCCHQQKIWKLSHFWQFNNYTS